MGSPVTNNPVQQSNSNTVLGVKKSSLWKVAMVISGLVVAAGLLSIGHGFGFEKIGNFKEMGEYLGLGAGAVVLGLASASYFSDQLDKAKENEAIKKRTSSVSQSDLRETSVTRTGHEE